MAYPESMTCDFARQVYLTQIRLCKGYRRLSRLTFNLASNVDPVRAVMAGAVARSGSVCAVGLWRRGRVRASRRAWLDHWPWWWA
jgi:hypothetical protein